MIQYDVIVSKYLPNLIRVTNDRLALGWKLQGGIAVATPPVEPCIMQAIYREVADPLPADRHG